MGEEEYRRWTEDAYRALMGKYTAIQREIIVEWFHRIKGSEERELIGNDAVEAMLVFTGVRFDCYDSMMARLFIYAPFILEQHAKENP